MIKKTFCKGFFTFRFSLFSSLLLAATATMAQPKMSKPHGLYDEESITVEITPKDKTAEVHYTTDGSTPTAESMLYTTPLTIDSTTVLRAVEVKEGAVSSTVTTASYIFISSVLKQSDTPEGYPTEWGAYSQIEGIAPADYDMDQEMTTDPTLQPKIIEGLKSLPILSVVTDAGNLFSHEKDENTGGIYIYTGPPVGDPTGDGWTRQCSAELFGGKQNHDFNVPCGLKLHGGHGRLAEKNPKHSLRLAFKKDYGQKSLKYKLFGEGEPSEFKQLVLRCHFGNSWQHWTEGNRQAAQYTRDVWARRTQKALGHTSVNALYVHLFLNGMYWGLYNIAERVDDQYGKDHLGGTKDDIDVIKIEEEGGNHIEASEGTLDAWNEMTTKVSEMNDPTADLACLDTLLDIPNFIDYMLINQYAGNTDWDHHNWYAIRRHNIEGSPSQGFRFLCWDSELIFGSPNENVVGKNNGKETPSGIFQQLLKNDAFRSQYVSRAKELFAEDGLLGATAVQCTWDSLYNDIQYALYDEAARWGDYRRDVHPYTTQGTLYTVDETYMRERNRLLTEYFPQRSETVLAQINSYLDIDDFDAPKGWVKLTKEMFCEWTSGDADATPVRVLTPEWQLGNNVSNGTTVFGSSGVFYNQFADLSAYDKIALRGSGEATVRILTNRMVSPSGPHKEIKIHFNENDNYWDEKLDLIIIPLNDFKTMLTSSNEERNDDFVHLQAIKIPYGETLSAKVSGIYLIPYQKGDVNRDSQITMADANAVVNYYLTPEAYTDFPVDAADMNNDGQITMADANAIVNVFLGGEQSEE